MDEHVILEMQQKIPMIRCTLCGAQEALHIPATRFGAQLTVLVQAKRRWQLRHASCLQRAAHTPDCDGC